MSAESVSKVCTICGEDCSQRPRIRDAQGRYTCKACAEARAASASKLAPQTAPSPAAEGVNAAFADFDFAPCPGCGAPLKSAVNVCVSCGYNKATGKQIKTVVSAAPSAPKFTFKPKDRSSSGGQGIPWDMIFNGVLVLTVLLVGLAVTTPSGFLMLSAFAGVLAIAGWIGSIAVPFLEGRRGWGMVNIFAMCIPLVGLATLYYCLLVTESGWLRRCWIAYFVSIVGIVVAIGVHGEDATVNKFGSGNSSVERGE